MQLLHENKTVVIGKDYNMTPSVAVKNISSSNLVVKDKQSSNASLLPMNPVASGDNVTTGLSSAHRLKEEMPALVPCCEGKELEINEEVVHSGLSAISVKHNDVIQCLSVPQACERMMVAPGLVKHRNSFRCLHRPDLKRVPYLRRMTPDELETLFRGYADIHTRRHGHSHNKEEATKMTLPPNKNNDIKNDKKMIALNDAVGMDSNALRSFLSTRSAFEDLPAGMRLHVTKARLYTSVLAGAKAGDQLDGISTPEELQDRVPEDYPEDEVQLHEELQIILPPRCEDLNTESTIVTPSTAAF